MKITVLTEKQDKVRKKVKNIVTWVLCPIWMPLKALYYLFNLLTEFIEHVLLYGMEDKIDDLITWVVKKIY